MTGEMDSVLAEFVNESREHLAGIETDLLTIEESGADVDVALVNKVFRAAHSIKGGSAFFGFQKVKELAHKAETVLDMLRSKKMTPNAEVTNILLGAFDKLREMINDTGASEEADIADLLVNLTGLASSWLPPEQKASLHTQVKLTTPAGDTVELLQADLDRLTRTGKYVYLVDCDLIHDIEKKGVNILTLFHKLTSAGEIVDCAVDFDAVGTLDDPVGNRVPLRLIIATVLDPDMVGGLFETIKQERIHMLSNPRHKGNEPISVPVPPPAPPESATAPTDVVERVPEPTEVALAPVAEAVAEPEPQHMPVPSGKSAAHTPSVTVEESLRVNVGLLENLMNLAGELVLSRNQLRAAVAGENRTLLSSADQRINQVTAELQDVIMQTRLQPIGNIFAKFPRVVRDLAQSLGKEIELDIRGKDVALDKTLIEGLSDPLTHMVRNAVDHGVESPEERRRSGKKPAGTVRIEARHDAGMVMVEIADNGKGIDGNKVAAAAVRKGLIAEEKLQGLTERDKQALVFLPGLSTAATVSDVSGRGVGMDVVKSNLDRLGGQVEISSAVGKGSTFSIKLPLTLAIMPSLIVSVGSERFAIPQTNIEELLRLRPDEIKERIRVAGDAETLLLRDRILPLVRFDRMVARREEIEAAEADGSALEIAVVTTGLMSYGLVVGAFHETEEVVVKPLGRRLKTLREYSGATILGDGAVALILDVAGVAAGADFSDVADSARAAELDAQIEAQRLEDTHSLLLFYNRPDEPCAVPLDLVQRIERVRPDQIEKLGRHRTMQYRGGSLPLVALEDAATVGALDDAQDLVVLVSKVSDHEVGLLGAMPVDVIETKATVDEESHRQKGVTGSSILRDRTTLIVDVFEVVDAVHPEWRSTKKRLRASESAPCDPDTLINLDQVEDPARQPKGSGTILLAEDSDFFRNQVKRYLQDDGFTVLAAPDGEAAWDLLVRNLDKVRLVVTDIEMPRLDGLGFTRRIRGDERTADLPVIAVTSLASEEDEQRGREAGVNQYHVKLDRDKLVDSVHRMMQPKEE